MLIRCEKCSTLYELDDNLLPPQGAPVQCSKCQFVFKAYPQPQPAPPAPATAAPAMEDLGAPHVANEPARGPAAEELPEPSADLVREGGVLASSSAEHNVTPLPTAIRTPTPPPTPPTAAPSSTPLGGASPDQKFTADGRPIRKVPFPTSEAPQPNARPVIAGGPARKGDRRIGRLVPVAVIVLIALALLAWWFLGHRRVAAAAPPGRTASSQHRNPSERSGADTPTAVSDDPARRPAPDPYAPAGAPGSDTGAPRAEGPSATPGSEARN